MPPRAAPERPSEGVQDEPRVASSPCLGRRRGAGGGGGEGGGGCMEKEEKDKRSPVHHGHWRTRSQTWRGHTEAKCLETEVGGIEAKKEKGQECAPFPFAPSAPSEPECEDVVLSASFFPDHPRVAEPDSAALAESDLEVRTRSEAQEAEYAGEIWGRGRRTGARACVI